jgi:hypothetical protein
MFVYFILFLLGYAAVFRLMSQTLLSPKIFTYPLPITTWGNVSVVHYISSIIWRPQGHYVNQTLPKTDHFLMKNYIRQTSEKADASNADGDRDSIRLLLIGDHVDW